MRIFDLFRSEESKARKAIRIGFDNDVKQAKKSGVNDPYMLGLLVEAAIKSRYNMFKSLKSVEKFRVQCENAGIDFDALLESEYNRAISKYLQYQQNIFKQ